MHQQKLKKLKQSPAPHTHCVCDVATPAHPEIASSALHHAGQGRAMRRTPHERPTSTATCAPGWGWAYDSPHWECKRSTKSFGRPPGEGSMIFSPSTETLNNLAQPPDEQRALSLLAENISEELRGDVAKARPVSRRGSDR